MLTVHKYKTFTGLAEDVKVARQFINQWSNAEGIPVRYASYLARKHDFHPALLRYKDYLALGGRKTYEELVRSCSMLSRKDKEYILEGTYPKDHEQFLQELEADLA